LTFKGTNAGATFVVAGLSLVAGLYFPTSLLPDWIRWLSDVQPFTPAAELLRHLLLGTEMSGSALVALLKLIGFAAVMLPVAAIVLRTSVQRSRRTGTITEY
jgi:ABC-2 type transport system permease protein